MEPTTIIWIICAIYLVARIIISIKEHKHKELIRWAIYAGIAAYLLIAYDFYINELWYEITPDIGKNGETTKNFSHDPYNNIDYYQSTNTYNNAHNGQKMNRLTRLYHEAKIAAEAGKLTEPKYVIVTPDNYKTIIPTDPNLTVHLSYQSNESGSAKVTCFGEDAYGNAVRLPYTIEKTNHYRHQYHSKSSGIEVELMGFTNVVYIECRYGIYQIE